MVVYYGVIVRRPENEKVEESELDLVDKMK